MRLQNSELLMIRGSFSPTKFPTVRLCSPKDVQTSRGFCTEICSESSVKCSQETRTCPTKISEVIVPQEALRCAHLEAVRRQREPKKRVRHRLDFGFGAGFWWFVFGWKTFWFSEGLKDRKLHVSAAKILRTLQTFGLSGLSGRPYRMMWSLESQLLRIISPFVQNSSSTESQTVQNYRLHKLKMSSNI